MWYEAKEATSYKLVRMEIKDIDHIAHLARLAIAPEEKQKLGKQLSGIFSYIEQLQEVDTKTTAPTAHVGGLENVMRDDVAIITSEALKTELRSKFPDADGALLRVPAIFAERE